MSISDTLNTEMRRAILSNKGGEVVVLYSQKMQQDIEWVEYHAFQNDLTLVFQGGATQNLGIGISATMKENLIKATQITLAHLNNDEIKSRVTVNLIISCD